ncbi:hypothetical protein M011DRAFT_6358 [Sporormia fimetaria CBS 119925]|uniref:Uncharacterized protein n=1 Tax=Sporormia fimetaria CBS 119925 TaxID=1340428 RepID=A0A6A6VRB9_9PLEO|nr:hypothetical protein M011DRAFT_6358 [Sporormia fimetaria CBS 119925]
MFSVRIVVLGFLGTFAWTRCRCIVIGRREPEACILNGCYRENWVWIGCSTMLRICFWMRSSLAWHMALPLDYDLGVTNNACM